MPSHTRPEHAAHASYPTPPTSHCLPYLNTSYLSLPTLRRTYPNPIQLCNDASLERHAATNLPLKAMATQYVANLKVASAAALGKM